MIPGAYSRGPSWCLLCVLVVALAIGQGCSTSEPVVGNEDPKITQIGRWSGPDVELMVEHWDRMCTEMGLDGPTLRSLCDVRQEFSPATPGKGSQRWGPATCDGHGCWHGIATWSRAGDYLLRWPERRHEGVIAHELMHPLQDMLIELGYMPQSEMDAAEPAGHPEHMSVDGRQYRTERVVDWRWPSVVESMLHAVRNSWWDKPHCATGFEEYEQGGGI